MHAVMKPFYNPIQIGFDPNVIQYASPYITPPPVSRAEKRTGQYHCAFGMGFKCIFALHFMFTLYVKCPSVKINQNIKIQLDMFHVVNTLN